MSIVFPDGTTSSQRSKQKPLEVSFWNYVNITDSDNCWNWKGGVCKQTGYGRSRGLHGDTVNAHRVAWELVNGPIPKFIGNRKALIRHLCSNRLCVNPRHLKLGNYSDNGDDAAREGKKVRFGVSEVRTIRGLRKQGLTFLAISKIFNITAQTISGVINRKGIYNEID